MHSRLSTGKAFNKKVCPNKYVHKFIQWEGFRGVFYHFYVLCSNKLSPINQNAEKIPLLHRQNSSGSQPD